MRLASAFLLSSTEASTQFLSFTAAMVRQWTQKPNKKGLFKLMKNPLLSIGCGDRI